MVPDSAMCSSSHKKKSTHCYLCGEPLSAPISRDHCPPLALFAKEIRKKHGLSQLITIPVHEACNESYKEDEEYFQATLVPFAPGSEAGNASFDQFMRRTGESDGKWNLAMRILREFEPRPSGLHLPTDRIVKRQEHDRIERVAWKIAHGVCFHEHGAILPESTLHKCITTPFGQQPSEVFQYVADLSEDETHGRYPGIFASRFLETETDLGIL